MRWSNAAACLTVGVLVAALASSPATAADPVDLGSPNTVRFDGATNVDQTGWSVSNAGDLNGDGRDDMAIGAFLADANSRPGSGTVWVVFGSANPGSIDLASLPASAGFRIDGASPGDQTGQVVAAAGDVNNDNRDDLLIGAPFADNNALNNSGASYVIYGTTNPGNLDLAVLSNTEGFRIDGQLAESRSGWSVAGAGDVNADGRDDVIVGAHLAGNNSRFFSGSAYVVYGSDSPNNVQLATLGTGGFRIDGAASSHTLGWSVARAGDMNDDGSSDVIVGATGANASYVIYGGATGTVDTNSLGFTQGFAITGAQPGDQNGFTVAPAGDVNNDGRDDVATASVYASPGGRTLAGSTYVVFGTASASNVNLASLGLAGFRIDGAQEDDSSGSALVTADLNNDNFDDLVIGAYEAGNNNKSASGSTYVVYGKANPTVVDLAALGAGGYRIDGAATNDRAGFSVGAGDFDGAGAPDLLIGAPYASNNNRPTSGSAYLVGTTSNPVAPSNPPVTTPPVTPPPTGSTPTAGLQVTARKAKAAVPRTGRTKLVKRVKVGPGQQFQITTKVKPKKARSDITVKTDGGKVTVRTKKAPKASIAVSIRATGSGYVPTTWSRTWNVR